MIDSTHRLRLEAALGSMNPTEALYALACALRDDGVSQIDLHLLFEHFQKATAADDPRYDAIVDNMDLIWGGPWAKGRDLFPTELTGEILRHHLGLPSGEVITPWISPARPPEDQT